jgi:hypothetical protein
MIELIRELFRAFLDVLQLVRTPRARLPAFLVSAEAGPGGES